MTKYKVIDDLATSIYSVELGLSEEQAMEMYKRRLNNEEWKNKLSTEINLAFSDGSFSWEDFFNEHDIYTADNEEDARLYAERVFLAPLVSSAKT